MTTKCIEFKRACKLRINTTLSVGVDHDTLNFYSYVYLFIAIVLGVNRSCHISHYYYGYRSYLQPAHMHNFSLYCFFKEFVEEIKTKFVDIHYV